jgi:predicted HAD superfamily hydrolase
LADWAFVHNTLTVRGVPGSGNLVHSLTEALATQQAQRRMPEDPLERIGYQTWGPLMFGFTCWLLDQFRREGIKHAAFVARDGWLMKQLVELILPSVPGLELSTSYLYLSRKIGLKTGVREWNPHRAWIYVGGKSSISPRRAIAAAGLNADDYAAMLDAIGLTDLDAPMDDEQRHRFFHFINSISMDILVHSMEMRQRFADYFDSVVPESGTLAFVDIGWLGNMQRFFLHSLSDKAVSARVSGFYLGLHRDHLQPNAELGMRIMGWLNGSMRYEELNEALLSGGVELLEFLLTAPHGSTIDLRKTEVGIEPVLEVQGPLEREHQEMALRAQKGVIRFIEDYRFLLALYSPEVLANPIWANDFIRLVMQPSQLELATLSGITHSDAVGSNDSRLVLARKLSPVEARDRVTRSRAREQAFWKVAFDKLNP